MSKVILTAVAKADLTEIRHYIADRLHNSSAALRTVASITKELHSLERFPQMGRIVNAAQNQNQYRVLVCGNYLSFYHMDAGTVYIDRVLYGRRDYLALLFGNGQEDEAEPEPQQDPTP